MSIILKLNKDMSCEYICKSIQKLINTTPMDNNEKVLVIEIRSITDDNNYPPKLTFKNSQD